MLDRGEFDAIWSDLSELMRDGVDVGRIDTVRPEHTPEAMGREPRKDDHGGEVYVYRRAGQPCYVCGTPISETSFMLISNVAVPIDKSASSASTRSAIRPAG